MTQPKDDDTSRGGLPCNCKGLGCEGRTFVCETCDREHPICRGGDGERYNECDDCWTSRQHAAA